MVHVLAAGGTAFRNANKKKPNLDQGTAIKRMLCRLRPNEIMVFIMHLDGLLVPV